MNAQPVLHKQVLEAGGPLAYARPSESSARRVVDNHCVMTGRPRMRQCRCVPEMREAPTCKVVPRGLEPRTLRLLAVRSNQLSYVSTAPDDLWVGHINFGSFGTSGVPWALWDPAALGAGNLLAVSSWCYCVCASPCQLPKNGGDSREFAGVHLLQPTL